MKRISILVEGEAAFAALLSAILPLTDHCVRVVITHEGEKSQPRVPDKATLHVVPKLQAPPTEELRAYRSKRKRSSINHRGITRKMFEENPVVTSATIRRYAKEHGTTDKALRNAVHQLKRVGLVEAVVAEGKKKFRGGTEYRLTQLELKDAQEQTTTTT